jgi:hypothetical protein
VKTPRRGFMKNALSHTHPQIAAEWHTTKNGDFTPDKLSPGSEKKAWWQCPASPSHEWQMSVVNRTGRASGCPFCRGLKASADNSLAALFPDLAAKWHPRKNGTVTPAQLVAGSARKVWWQCPNDSDHQWEASVDIRTNGGCGCPSAGGAKSRPLIRLLHFSLNLLPSGIRRRTVSFSLPL